jgi:general secretion pathway protein G
MYKLHNGRYPSTDQGLQALVTRPSGSPEPRNWGPTPYLSKYPLDQWGNEFLYIGEGSRFELVSMGADGTDGGEGGDADISYADL